jgi:GNAT superfamily N-acetyltransferase
VRSAKAPERAERGELPPTRTLPPGVVIRSARDPDEAGIKQLVRDVVREVYGDLFPAAAGHRAGNWRGGLLAEIDGRVVGVAVADDDWVEDLWVTKEHRRRGIGGVLLAAAERRIAERGHAEARLRVVARNFEARRFYVAHGWAEAESYPREWWGFAMLEMVKVLAV